MPPAPGCSSTVAILLTIILSRRGCGAASSSRASVLLGLGDRRRPHLPGRPLPLATSSPACASARPSPWRCGCCWSRRVADPARARGADRHRSQAGRGRSSTRPRSATSRTFKAKRVRRRRPRRVEGTALVRDDDRGPGPRPGQAALEAGVDLIVAAGGDGTVRAVCEEVARTGVAVGILPHGTGNLLARNLGLPAQHPRRPRRRLRRSGQGHRPRHLRANTVLDDPAGETIPARTLRRGRHRHLLPGDGRARHGRRDHDRRQRPAQGEGRLVRLLRLAASRRPGSRR